MEGHFLTNQNHLFQISSQWTATFYTIYFKLVANQNHLFQISSQWTATFSANQKPFISQSKTIY
jgi:hypothetical protein